ncbi:metal-dependent hydrolase [Sphingomonas tabacisoli]|uniref:Metal-dependent hydrolase n=1 Tax=Sphingomonas tabacisoli TaxID=2249466 RepID=A0ABW4I010_9SPHN
MQIAAKTPADLTITPRDRRFGRKLKQGRWWHGGDPIATAWHNALSITFPRGEAFFIESVKAFRDGAPPKLEAEIKAFTMQEVMHSREHVAFNKRVVDAGYDIAHLEQVVVDSLELTKGRPQILNLAVTMALEHYTAMLAQMMLKHPRYWTGVDAETKAMWQWHAIEEIEHKGVAYDTWAHATKGWSRWRRWKVKSIMMLLVTYRFWTKRWEGTLELLAQDGIEGAGAKARLLWYLVGSPGPVRHILPAWLAYFLPGFHPWNHDDRALIAKAGSAYPDARLPAAA